MPRLCLLRFKHQFALKTFSVGEVMTDMGSLDSQSAISLAVDRWRNGHQQNKVGILKQNERENIDLQNSTTTGPLLHPCHACST